MTAAATRQQPSLGESQALLDSSRVAICAFVVGDPIGLAAPAAVIASWPKQHWISERCECDTLLRRDLTCTLGIARCDGSHRGR